MVSVRGEAAAVKVRKMRRLQCRCGARLQWGNFSGRCYRCNEERAARKPRKAREAEAPRKPARRERAGVRRERAEQQKAGRMSPLREQFRAGLPVQLDQAFQAAGLTPKERHVLGQRLLGRAWAAIAGDPECRTRNGTAPHGANVAEMERKALDKLGVGGSMADLVRWSAKAERIERLREAAGFVSPRDLRHTEDTARPRGGLRKWAREDARQEEMVAEFLRGR